MPFAKALQALPSGSYVLAVSGGRDSMALLHGFARWRRSDLSAVATFDHGTGPAATHAVELVVHECLTMGVPVEAGREASPPPRRTEAHWRASRWAFLRAVAEERRATIVTAHTLDDQAETVAMRILRDASARGLAAMAWPSPGVVRPLLSVRRAELAAYAAQHHVPFVDDPSNRDARYLRNRLRAQLLDAIERARPGFAAELAAIGDAAAQWRGDLAALVDALGVQHVGDVTVIEASALASLPEDGLRVLWPEIAGRGGVVLDWRGVQRLSRWTPRAVAGQRVPVSGGAVVERTARTFVVRRG